MIRLLILCLSVFVMASCAEVQHLDEALRLKEFSDDGDAKDAMISRYQAKFLELVKRITQGDQLKDMVTTKDLIAWLGDPVLIRSGSNAGETRWLYRDPMKYFDTPKVYFFVDAQGRVLRWTSVGITQNISQIDHEPKGD
ncbi:MAG: hypothetical protein HQL21_07350 [Candidatus Omnitrophica bacterium]|nr:hypothetical protein [Candidatus Omnitrophota bacterium]